MALEGHLQDHYAVDPTEANQNIPFIRYYLVEAQALSTAFVAIMDNLKKPMSAVKKIGYKAYRSVSSKPIGKAFWEELTDMYWYARFLEKHKNTRETYNQIYQKVKALKARKLAAKRKWSPRHLRPRFRRTELPEDPISSF